MHDPAPRLRSGLVILGLIVAVAIVVLIKMPPRPQDQKYHQFADQRALLFIPNAWNVLSNLPFLVVGAAGVARLLRPGARRDLRLASGWRWAATSILVVGVALVALGSGYYHWCPSDGPLVWDRLPITVVFMALLALVLGDRIDERLLTRLLVPLLALGIVSAVIWRPLGDLRLYGIVQYGAALAVVAVAAAFAPTRLPGPPLWIALGLYGLAKLVEWDAADDWIFAHTGHFVSGHALKHLFAAGATSAIVRMVVSPPAAAHR